MIRSYWAKKLLPPLLLLPYDYWLFEEKKTYLNLSCRYYWKDLGRIEEHSNWLSSLAQDFL